MQVNKRNEESKLGGRVHGSFLRKGRLTLASIFILPTIIPEDLA